MDNMNKTIVLGEPMDLEKFMAIVRGHAQVEFSEEYKNRVNAARALVDQWVTEEKVMYGITTGVGALCTQTISKEDTAKL